MRWGAKWSKCIVRSLRRMGRKISRMVLLSFAVSIRVRGKAAIYQIENTPNIGQVGQCMHRERHQVDVCTASYQEKWTARGRGWLYFLLL